MSALLEHGALIIAVLNFAFTIGAAGIGVYVKATLAQMEIDLHKAIAESGQEIDERIEKQGREFGETVLAIRTKITDVELYVRDNYVRYDSFASAIDKLDKQLVRMEGKLDQLRDIR